MIQDVDETVSVKNWRCDVSIWMLARNWVHPDIFLPEVYKDLVNLREISLNFPSSELLRVL